MCAMGFGTLLARYSSRQPSMPPPGWKQVGPVWPGWSQFEHRRIDVVLVDRVLCGSVMGVDGTVVEAV